MKGVVVDLVPPARRLIETSQNGKCYLDVMHVCIRNVRYFVKERIYATTQFSCCI